MDGGIPIMVIDWGDLPAWIQAVGSVAAIFAAIWISEYGHNRQARATERERIQRAKAWAVGTRLDLCDVEEQLSRLPPGRMHLYQTGPLLDDASIDLCRVKLPAQFNYSATGNMVLGEAGNEAMAEVIHALHRHNEMVEQYVRSTLKDRGQFPGILDISIAHLREKLTAAQKALEPYLPRHPLDEK